MDRLKKRVWATRRWIKSIPVGRRARVSTVDILHRNGSNTFLALLLFQNKKISKWGDNHIAFCNISPSRPPSLFIVFLRHWMACDVCGADRSFALCFSPCSAVQCTVATYVQKLFPGKTVPWLAFVPVLHTVKSNDWTLVLIRLCAMLSWIQI